MRSILLRRFLFVAFPLLWLANCASYQGTPFDRKANAELGRIALVEPKNPKRYEAVAMSNTATQVGAMFGLIGGLVGAAILADQNETRTTEFDTKLRPSLDFAQRLGDVMAARLAAGGRAITRVPAPELGPEEKFFDAVGRVTTDADGILMLVPVASYLAKFSSGPYNPVVVIEARLFKRETNALLYSQLLSFGGFVRDGATLGNDPQYSFPTSEALLANTPRAVEAFEHAIQLAATRLAIDLER